MEVKLHKICAILCNMIGCRKIIQKYNTIQEMCFLENKFIIGKFCYAEIGMF